MIRVQGQQDVLAEQMVMAAAALIERRLGPAAAGWLAALPVSLAVAVAAVSLDAGTGTAGALARSAATHVPAQVGFALVFAGVLVHRGLLLGATAGAFAYVACAIALAALPAEVVVACALPALALAPGLMPAARPRSGSPRRWQATALTCAAASAVVGATVVTSRLAGPAMAGAIAAFPVVSTTLAVAVVTRDGNAAGAHVLAGLVRSLPCYLAFCLVIVLAAPSFGLAATALGLLACAATAGATWHGIPVRRAAPAR